MRTPITYYGGKQKLAAKIVSMIPEHVMYVEPFIGGGAVFFQKEPSEIEVINDTDKEMINFYRVVQNDFVSLEKEVRISLHARDLHRKASVIRANPDMFSELKRAWAVWVLAAQSFSGLQDGSWGYDLTRNTTSKKIDNKRKEFSEEYAIRLQRTQIECTDALRIILSRDSEKTFFYCDPPYYNSDMGHYDGYTIEDFKLLLERLATVKGRFILSSYPSELLAEYTKQHGWRQELIESFVSVNKVSKTTSKRKVEVLTWNYDLKAV